MIKLIKSIKLVKSLKVVKLITPIVSLKLLKSNQLNKVKPNKSCIHKANFLFGFIFISVVYMLKDQRQNYLFLFNCLLTKQKQKKVEQKWSWMKFIEF